MRKYKPSGSINEEPGSMEGLRMLRQKIPYDAPLARDFLGVTLGHFMDWDDGHEHK